MKRMTLVAILAISLLGCKKKPAGDTAGSGSDPGSAMMGSGSGSGSGSAAMGSGFAVTDTGSGSAAADALPVLITDATSGNREADLKTAADKAVAMLPADVKAGGYSLHVTLRKLDTKPKFDCELSVAVADSNKAVFALLHGSATVEVDKGKEEGADDDCFTAVLEDLIVKKLPKAIEDKKAGKPDDVGSGMIGSGSAAPANK